MRHFVLGVNARWPYYEFFCLEPKLVLSPEDLQQRFYQLSRKLHPDRFVRKPEAERQQALDASSELNDAYRTLKDPLKRIEYVLEQEGFKLGEQRSKDVPPELLEEVFELNMALEEADGPQIEAARKKFVAMLADIDGELEKMFASYDASPEPAKLSEIRGILNRRRYINNLVRDTAAQTHNVNL